MTWHLLITVGLVWLSTETNAQDNCVCLEQFGTEDLRNPTFFRVAPGDNDRLFVGEQIGYVWLYDRAGNRNPEPFLDVSDRFQLSPGYDELGLLDMIFHPDFQTNRKFYAYFTQTTNPDTTRLAEFQTDIDNPNVADMDTERIIMEFDQPAYNHNGGTLMFGMNDGYLYLTLGDGGTAYLDNAQDMSTHLGKIVRIDINTGDDGIPYIVPDDNPFLDEPGALPEIYGLGLRNPWRCTQDEGDVGGENRGRMMCADVGANYCEEVNIVQSGANFGWPVKECMYCYPPDLPDPDPECPAEVSPGVEVLPIFHYTEWAGHQSITGGPVYRGSAFPEFYGNYIWTDWAVRDQSGVCRLIENEDDTWTNQQIPLCDASACVGLIAEHQYYAFSFGVDQDRDVYILESSTVSPQDGGGVIYKMVPPPGKK